MKITKVFNLSRDKNRHPVTGFDIPEYKLQQIKEVLEGKTNDFGNWEEAQLRELGFWRWVAYEGYMDVKPRDFYNHQKQFMLESFNKTGWNSKDFADTTIVELGCGPLGLIEFIPGANKIGIDPLNFYYSLLFARFRSSDVKYLLDFSELKNWDKNANLIICFNVIDHTQNPLDCLTKLFEVLKPGGKFFIEVNCHRDDYVVTAEHKKMHPSPLTHFQVRELVSRFGTINGSFEELNPTSDDEYPLILWGHSYSSEMALDA